MTDSTIVIVGANLAGGRAAETLREEGFDGRIFLIGQEPHRPYERPPLSKAWPSKPAFLRGESWYEDNEIELMLGVRASMLDVADKVVMAGGRLLPFDAVLLCTGGSPRRLEVPGAHLEGVHTLRTLDDASAIAASIAPGARIVVVGAGFIGAEVAASARTAGCEVTLLEAESIPMGRALGAEVGEILGQIHRDHGVDLRTGVAIDRFEGDTRAHRVVLKDGPAFDSDVIVVGVGIEPNVELAAEAGVACDNGILVDERCATSVPFVFAAGDVANHPNPILGERIRVEHWQNAQNQGAAAARAMLGKLERYEDLPWFWSDQYDVNLQMFGHPGNAERVVFRGDVDARSFAAFYLRGPRMLAAFAVNRAKDARAVRGLIRSGAAVDAAALADESTDLRALGVR